MKTLPELIAEWPVERQEEWEERAAIIEFDGKMTRNNAESMAYRQILKAMREASSPKPSSP